MNKRQREVEEAKLAREKKILETLKQQYQRAAKDIAEKTRFHTEKIDALLSEWDGLDEKQKSVLRSQIYQRNYQLMLRRQIDRVLDQLNRGQYDRISEYLKECHEMAQVGTLYDLHGQNIPLMLPVQQEDAVKAAELDAEVSGKLYGGYVTELKQHIRAELTRGISAGLSYGELARNLNGIATIGLNKAMRIVRTEGHRIQQEGQFKTQHQAKEAGADIVKQWDSTLDGRTRPTHRKLDGQIRELNEPFEAEGKRAMYPGDFGRPEEDINCRCTLLQRATWVLDEEEMETLKERAAYFGLDKTTAFEEFREKYLKAIQTSVKDGIIKTDKQFGKKIGKHAQDYGLNPSDSTDRKKMRAIIDDILLHPDETASGTWRGQTGTVDFYIKGKDVVIVNGARFVTILKNGVNNARVKDARKRKV